MRDELKGFDPAAVALRDLLESDAARRLLDAKTLKFLAKQATGKPFTSKPGEAPQDQRKRFLEAALKLGKLEEPRRALVARAARPAPDPADRERVLEDLWRLGSLGEADLEIERARLFENPVLLGAMAEHAYGRSRPARRPRACSPTW